jgi:hypothetical protein
MIRPSDGVLGYHLNPLTCGVARFNQILAQQMGVPMLGLFDPRSSALSRPLISIKLAELAARDREALATALDRRTWGHGFRLFLHAWSDTALERRLVGEAEAVYCGNSELAARLSPLRGDLISLWCPGTLMSARRFQDTELSVFSFGMAHKVRADLYRKLHALLEATGRTYSVLLSTALHEGTAFDESFAIVFDDLRQIFGEHIYFLGYLSDTAVYNQLLSATFFAAFFDQGVRANNTTVNAAMECGSVVITNLDAHSPEAFVHGDNVLDIHSCAALPTVPGDLARLRARASASPLSWSALLAGLRRHEGAPPAAAASRLSSEDLRGNPL